MKIRTTLFSVLLLGMLTSCDFCTNENFVANGRYLQGHSKHEVIQVYGAPTSTYQVDNHTEVLIYSSSHIEHIDAVEPTIETTVDESRPGKTLYKTQTVGGSPARDIQYSCDYQFMITHGKVTDFKWKGNDCCDSFRLDAPKPQQQAN